MNLFLDSVVVIIVVVVEQPDFKKRPIKMFAYRARAPQQDVLELELILLLLLVIVLLPAYYRV